MKVIVVVCSVFAFIATIPLIKSTNPNLPLCPETPLCKPPLQCPIPCRPRPELPLCPETPLCKPPFKCPIPCTPRPELPLCPEKPIPLPKGAHAPIPCRPRPTTPAPTTSYLGMLYL